MQNLDNLNLVELRNLLNQVKNYKDLKVKLWNRWIELYKRNLAHKDLYLVEYFGETSLDDIYNISNDIYKNTFKVDLKKDDIKFVRNDDLKWGVKVYKNDSMVDLSFSRIEKLIK